MIEVKIATILKPQNRILQGNLFIIYGLPSKPKLKHKWRIEGVLKRYGTKRKVENHNG
jgi:hypothetical protein